MLDSIFVEREKQDLPEDRKGHHNNQKQEQIRMAENATSPLSLFSYSRYFTVHV